MSVAGAKVDLSVPVLNFQRQEARPLCLLVCELTDRQNVLHVIFTNISTALAAGWHQGSGGGRVQRASAERHSAPGGAMAAGQAAAGALWPDVQTRCLGVEEKMLSECHFAGSSVWLSI